MSGTDTTEDSKDQAAKLSSLDAHKPASSLRSFSVKAAGVGTLIADAALITRGITKRENMMWHAGAFGVTAGLVGALWGNPGTGKQLDQLYKKLGNYLRKEGVVIPNDPTAEALSKEGGLLSRIDTFLSAYPTQVMNVFYGLIGTSFALEGKRTKSGLMKTSGSLLIAGALAGLLIEEKKPDPEHPPDGVLGKTWGWIQQKPLRLTGTLFNANQVFLGLSALDEWKTNPADKKYIYKAIAVAGFTFGNIMLALSSTSHGGSDKKADPKILNELADTAARVIAAQPKEVQDGLLEHVAGFMASQPHMDKSADQISAVLHEKLDAVKAAYPQALAHSRINQSESQGRHV